VPENESALHWSKKKLTFTRPAGSRRDGGGSTPRQELREERRGRREERVAAGARHCCSAPSASSRLLGVLRMIRGAGAAALLGDCGAANTLVRYTHSSRFASASDDQIAGCLDLSDSVVGRIGLIELGRLEYISLSLSLLKLGSCSCIDTSIKYLYTFHKHST
jgi:hypothetical protein